MKTLKLVLIATIVSIACMSYAETPTHPVKHERVITITLKQALTIPGLVGAMHHQLTPAFLQVEPPGLYTAKVRYKHRVFEIRGSRQAWVEFFRIKPGWAPID